MKYNAFLPVVALALTLPMVQAQEAPAPAQTVQQAGQAMQELEEDPQITRGQLANGLSYIVRPTTEPKGRASLRLFVNTGSLDEREHEKGISHLLEHLVFNGSRTHKRGDLIPAMQKLGLGFGGDVNAYTSLLQTVYMLNLPNLKDETVDFAFTVLRDFADGATLEDTAIDHERGIVRSELYARDSASYRSSIAMLRHAAPGMRLADYLPIGTEEVIMGAPHEVFRNYYKTHYVPRNMTVVVTGDFAPEQAAAWVEKHFSSMEDIAPAPRPSLGTFNDEGAADMVFHNPENAMTSVTLSVSTPYEEKPDTMEQRIKNLPLELACAMVNQRLARIAREADAPFSQADASKESIYESADTFALSVVSEHEKWKEAMEAALLELRRACIYGFNADELKEIVATTMAAHDRQVASWTTVDAASMAQRIISSLTNKETLTTPAESLRSFEAGLARVMQNPDVCRQALQEAFDTSKVRLFMSGANVGGTSGADLRTVYHDIMQREVSAPVEEELPPFAYDKVGEPGSIEKQELIEDLGVTTLTLSNGIRINLKPVDFQKGSVSVSAYIDGGSIRMLDTPGLPSMVSSVMRLGALEAHDLTELEKIMAGEHVSFNFGMGLDRIRVSGTTTAKDFELQCKLLVAGILHPGFRKDGEIMLRRQLPAVFNRYETTPNGAFGTQSSRLTYGDDPRFTTPTRAQIESCTAEQVKEALTPWLQKGAMEISVVGDFKVEEVIPALLRTFGAMPERNREFTPMSDAETSVENAKWGQRHFLPYTTDLDKTIVAQVRPCGDGMDHRRNRRMSVLAAIVREKLFDGIRAQLGETYSPSVQFAPNSNLRNAAIITTASAGVVGNRIKVNTAMDAILVDVGQGKIDQAEFDCAIRPFISRTLKGLRTIGYWENGLACLQSDPRQLPLMRDLVEDVKSITLDEIQQLAREVFGQQDKINYFFTVPASAVPAEAAPTPEAPAATPAEPADYTIISSESTMADAAWAAVAEELKKKHENARIISLAELSEQAITAALRSTGSRYAACVLRPQEVDRVLVNNLHRAARQVDADPWGDCIWGIITGYTADDAMRIAKAGEPLVIKRMLGSTNVDHSRFEHSCCITDWTDAPVREQSGYTEPTTTTYPFSVENDKLLGIFSGELSNQAPQFVVSSSHATPFNLEMPFSRGLLFSYGNRFHQLPINQLRNFGEALHAAMKGKDEHLARLAPQYPEVKPDGTPRVWIAAGNCLFGDAHNSPNSMCVTALSAYTCNQVVGYTVPSWYGEGGWGTLGTFMGNTAGTSLAEAWFLNNQFILHRSRQITPDLLNIEFNDEQFSPNNLISELMQADIPLQRHNVKDIMGLVHDRDVVAFYGDPAWRAQLDESHAQAPYSIAWQSDKKFTITANYDTKERCAVWFPTAATGKGATGCSASGAIFTNDFILFPTMELKKGESLQVEIN